MPRGRKSKLKASEKRRQARLETQGHAVAQATKAAAEASAEAGVAATSMASAEALLAGAAEASAEALLAGAAEASAEALLAGAAEASDEALLAGAAEASDEALLAGAAEASAQAAVAAGKAATATKGKAAAVAASIAPVVVKKRAATEGRKAEEVGKKTSTPQPMHGTKVQPHSASAANFKKPQEEQHVATSSKSQKKKPSFFASPLYLNPDQVARKANELEQFLLCKFKTKKVILKKDMLEIIGAELEEHFDEILKKASVGIEMEFAVKVMEVDPVIHSFDLVSKIKLPNNGRLRPGQGLPKTGLLMNILGIILLKGNRATEEDLWKYLGKMKVFPGRKHSLYGEPRKLITIDLVRLNYLVYRQIPKSDPPRFEFLWGPKAYAETSKKQVIEFLATIIGHEPSVLLAQFKDLLKEEDK
ncbi:melanoma-associated antigen B3-like [Suncus etruscus]|uniref:melanoma-associated antigen B3-like n=1 Tax=Suncus etruscus TaxID=109475 RepID=UPI0021102F07|nr:melanoma-associated antigen B3-like [Suncus etruscus]XP_049622801.1 melanoma-associated antigen B3-like [Suncus etruscus]